MPMSTASYDYNTGTMPRYKEPAFDWGRVGGLQQEQMASPLAESRRELRNIRAMSFGNPMEMEEAYRGGLRGYGESIGNIQAGGMRSALGMYGEELSGKRRQAMSDYERALMEWKLKEKEAALGLTGTGGTSAALPKLPGTFVGNYNAPLKPQSIQAQPGYNRGDLPMPTTPITYGAGSEEAWRRAMGNMGGRTATTSGWSV